VLVRLGTAVAAMRCCTRLRAHARSAATSTCTRHRGEGGYRGGGGGSLRIIKGDVIYREFGNKSVYLKYFRIRMTDIFKFHLKHYLHLHIEIMRDFAECQQDSPWCQ
jgi:hypothetical protein